MKGYGKRRGDEIRVAPTGNVSIQNVGYCTLCKTFANTFAVLHFLNILPIFTRIKNGRS
jgi:hypothetical protein